MKTDVALYEIFEHNPSRLEELLGRHLPKYSGASSQALKKTISAECDLLFEPVDPKKPRTVLEIQLYFDHAIFRRTEVSCHLVWKHLNRRSDCLKKGYVPVEVRGIIIFGDASQLPEGAVHRDDIEYYFLDDLLEQLKVNHPNSPLIQTLAPLTATTKELETKGSRQYAQIKSHPQLTVDEKEVMCGVYLHFFLQRFKSKTYQEVKTMLAELAPLEETVVGQELIGKGRKEGRESAERNLVRAMRGNGFEIEAIASATGLSENRIRSYFESEES